MVQEKIHSKFAKDQLDKTTESLKELERDKIKYKQDKLVAENKLITFEKIEIQKKAEENKCDQKILDSQSSQSLTKRRYAFLVANTYAQSISLKPLPGTEKSIKTVETILKLHGFQTEIVLNEDIDNMTKKLDNWKSHSSKNADLGALLFYFCGHGGHLPVVSDNNTGDENNPAFYGSTGNISLVGDYILDNNNHRMFKNQILKRICQVYSDLFLLFPF